MARLRVWFAGGILISSGRSSLKFIFIAMAGTLLLGSLPSRAQEKRVSPHDTISAVVHGDRVTVVYGRPYTKDPQSGKPRIIWGGLVPYGQVWRTGADEATLFITQNPLHFGNTYLPKGAYTIWILPNQDGSAKLIFNRQIGQWGIGPGSYDPHNDLARIDLKSEVLSTPVDEFTIAVGETPSGGILRFSWEKTQFSATFKVGTSSAASTMHK